MSAFICSNTHIMTVAAAYVYNVELRNEHLPDDAQVLRVAKILQKENVASVNYRYETKYRAGKLEGTPYSYHRHVQMLAWVDCLSYQSCERSRWDKSEAKRMLTELELCLLRKMIDPCLASVQERCTWTPEG
jgi:hypothetical protein